MLGCQLPRIPIPRTRVNKLPYHYADHPVGLGHRTRATRAPSRSYADRILMYRPGGCLGISLHKNPIIPSGGIMALP